MKAPWIIQAIKSKTVYVKVLEDNSEALLLDEFKKKKKGTCIRWASEKQKECNKSYLCLKDERLQAV